ncbi:MAG TPA: histidine kinase [Phnomibacter sp.]|nr:histidine kinase [Phnomibacter sp.]
MLVSVRYIQIIVCCLPFCLLGSMTVQAQYTTKDSAYIFSLINKAESHFTDARYDSALYYANHAADISRQKKCRTCLAYAQIEAADVYIEIDALDKAAAEANAVQRLGMQMKDSLIIAVSNMQLGQTDLYKDKFSEAIVLLQKSLDEYLAAHPTKYSALAYNDLGYCWGRVGNISKQAEYLLKAIHIYETYFPTNYGELGIAFNNLSTVHYNLNQMDKAIEYAKRSLAYKEKNGDKESMSIGCCNISQFYNGISKQEAEKYLQLCVQYALESNKDSRIVHSYISAGNFYAANKQFATALDYELKAISKLERSGRDVTMLYRRYIAAGNLSAQLGQDTAISMNYYNKAQALLNENTTDKLSIRDFYLQLSNFYRDHQQYEQALSNYKKFILYKDSIVTEKTRSSIAEIETRYETKKKDDQIDLLKVNERLKQLEIEKQKAIINGNKLEAEKKQTEIDLLSQQREMQEIRIAQQVAALDKQQLQSKFDAQQLQLARKEKELQQKELQAQKQWKTLLLAGVLLFVLVSAFIFNRYKLKKKLERQQELLSIRNNIARDLHDEIGSALTSIKILSEVSKNNIGKDTHKAANLLAQITEQSDEMQQGMSDIVWAIKPDNDKLQNILVRMREYVAHVLEPRNIVTRFVVSETMLQQHLDMQQRRDFFLIFKESVNNIVKYAAATEVEIEIYKEAANLVMLIKDNGKGFDINAIAKISGLKNIQTRAAILQGTADISSEAGKGTTVKVQIPTTS